MTTEELAPNVVIALSRVIRDLPAIGKDATMQGAGGGYAYRGIAAVTRELAPLLAKHGVVFVPTEVRSWERDNLVVNNRPWTDDRIVEHYRIYGPGGPSDFVEAEVAGIGRDNSDKGSNKALTACFKYLLTQTLCIADAKDDGDNERHETESRQAPPPDPHPIPQSRVDSVLAAAQDKGIPEATIVRFVRAATKHRTGELAELLDSEYATFAAAMKAEVAKLAAPPTDPAGEA
jgi:hypothetical protein